MKAHLKKGFTMIELLVVIVIIGVLSASLFPAVSSFMLKGKLTGMAGKAGKIVKAMVQAETDETYAGRVWPSDTVEETEDEDTNGPKMSRTFTSTADYFTEALYVKETNPKTRENKKVLKGVDPSDIAGEGVPAASGTQIKEANCAWILAKNTSGVPEKTPVLVTRNVDTQVLVGLAGNDTSTDYEKLLSAKKPFEKDGCVIAYKDSSTKTFTSGDVKAKGMLPGLGPSKLSDFEANGNKFDFLRGSSN